MSSPLGTGTLEERRAFILETAARLFASKGYAGTSVDDIARELGVSKANIYYYWGSKEELLEEIQDRALVLLREQLNRLNEEENPYETRLEATVAAYIDAVFENRSFISVLLRDFVSSEKTREKRRAYMRQCREAIEAEMTAGNVRAFDPQVLTLALVNLCSSIANWYEPEGRLNREEIKEIYLELVARGLLPLSEATPEPGHPPPRFGSKSPRPSE
jgi:TetR/AcrR family transcriptional regulator, cholesterol catabolism regulator